LVQIVARSRNGAFDIQVVAARKTKLCSNFHTRFTSRTIHAAHIPPTQVTPFEECVRNITREGVLSFGYTGSKRFRSLANELNHFTLVAG
jgi:hypothetical protein